MQRNIVADTDVEVSPLCVGTWIFGRPVPEDESVAIVHWALEHDINFFDTADMYDGYDRFIGSPGQVAETILGQALHDRRAKAIVTTKVGNAIGPGPDDRGLGRTHIMRQIDASLQRLQTDYVDFYLLHRPDPETPLQETIAVMAEVIDAGKARYWGFSNFQTDQIRQMIEICDSQGHPRPVMNQPPYSWLKREIEDEELPLCNQLHIAVTPFQALQGGLLTGKYRRGRSMPSNSRAVEKSDWLPDFDDDLFDKLEQFEREAQAADLSPSQYAIRWAAQKPGITSIIVGVKRVEQLATLV